MNKSTKNRVILKQVVGIDQAMSDFKVSFQIQYEGDFIKTIGSSTFSNTEAGFEKLVLWVKRKKQVEYPLLFVVEATGVYYEDLAYYIYNQNFDIAVVLPLKAKYFKQSLNIVTKNDNIDAACLALMGIQARLVLWKPMSPAFKSLRFLTRELQQLGKDIVRAKNQKHALVFAHECHESVLNIKQQQITFLENQKKEIKRIIKSEVQTDKVFHSRIKKLEKVKGLGFDTIIILLAETNGFELFNSRSQLFKYAGMDIIENESGKVTGKTRISKRGNSKIRSCLYMPAMSSTNHNVTMIAYFEKMLEVQGVYRKALVPVMRKLLGLVYTLWKSGEEYNPNYEIEKQQRVEQEKLGIVVV